jgi:tetratricopeptide (TPR) repeat protein
MQESLKRRVALKVLPQASLLSGNQLERFRREAQVAANLHHTHIVPVFGSGEADGYHYYAMQFIEGRGLDAVVRDLTDRKPSLLSPDVATRAREVARIGEDVARALHHAHQLGTLHRDVKPANLLIEHGGHCWVTDFGLAKALQYDGLTHSGDVLGTLQYLAPEQLDGRYDARSEVYALGLVLYELLALRPAFSAGTRSELIDKIRTGRCEPLRRVVTAIPGDLATILERAANVEPSRRYADASAFAADLRAFAEDRPIAARRTSHIEHAWRWCRRNRALAGTTILALLAMVSAAVVGWIAYLVTDEARTQAEASAQQARTASSRAENNLALTMSAFEDVFDSLVGPDPFHAIADDSDDEGGAVVALRAPVDSKDAAVLQRMLTFYDKFAEQNASSPGLREQTARAYRRVGGIQARLSKLDAATTAFEKSLQLYRDVHERGVALDIAAVQQELGQVAKRSGNPSAARKWFQNSLRELENDLTGSGTHASRLLRARGSYLLATSLEVRGGGPFGRRGQVPPENEPPPGGGPGSGPPSSGGPGSPGGRRGGRDGMREGFRESREQLRAARELLAGLLQETPEDPEVLLLQARVLIAEQRAPTSREQAPDPGPATKAIEILEKLVQRQPDNDLYRYELADALLPPPGRNADVAVIKTVLEHAEKLVAQQPAHVEYQALLGRAHSMLGRQLRRTDPEEAEKQLRAALAVEAPLSGKQESASPRFQEQFLMTRVDLARLLSERGKTEEARTLLTQVVAQLQAIAEKSPGLPRGFGDPERLRDLWEQLDRAGLGARSQQLRALMDRRGR